MELLESTIARLAHHGQKYGASQDYYTAHVEKVVAQVEQDPAATSLHRRAAYLHDVLEDTHYTAGDLLDLGVMPLVTALVAVLTRNPAENYGAYIARIAVNRDAAIVKRADLRANIAAGPLPGLLLRYTLALRTLSYP